MALQRPVLSDLEREPAPDHRGRAVPDRIPGRQPQRQFRIAGGPGDRRQHLFRSQPGLHGRPGHLRHPVRERGGADVRGRQPGIQHERRGQRDRTQRLGRTVHQRDLYWAGHHHRGDRDLVRQRGLELRSRGHPGHAVYGDRVPAGEPRRAHRAHRVRILLPRGYRHRRHLQPDRAAPPLDERLSGRLLEQHGSGFRQHPDIRLHHRGHPGRDLLSGRRRRHHGAHHRQRPARRSPERHAGREHGHHRHRGRRPGRGRGHDLHLLPEPRPSVLVRRQRLCPVPARPARRDRKHRRRHRGPGGFDRDLQHPAIPGVRSDRREPELQRRAQFR